MENNIEKAEKLEMYSKLCNKVKEYYRDPKRELNEYKKVHMQWCEKEDFILDNREINLWTYWQDGNKKFQPKILLVGQDWGCPWTESDGQAIINIRAINDYNDAQDKSGLRLPCYMEGNDNPTNNNLAELFKTIDYDDIYHKKYDDLFFTNLVLGYRSSGNSGNFTSRWLTEDNNKYFAELVKLLQPKVIICLGQTTYDGTLKALGSDERARGTFGKYIESQETKPIKVCNNKVAVYAVAHCGSMGTSNRNKYAGRIFDEQEFKKNRNINTIKKDKSLSAEERRNKIKKEKQKWNLRNQYEDWKMIKNYLDKI